MTRPRPKLLDGCCCEGGTHVGYERAGFDVYGIDLFVDYSRKRYPGPSYQGDVVLALVLLLAGQQIPFTHRDGSVEWLGLADFAAVHVSPPCQHASAGTRAIRSTGAKEYPALIEPLRYLLQLTGLPYVIENVKGAALRDPVMLCGSMFDLTATDADGTPLRLERHRLFETSFPLTAPAPDWHDPDRYPAGVYGGSRRAKRVSADETLAELAPRDRHAARHVRKGGYVPRSVTVRRELLGIEWMTGRGMDQAVPPAYAEHVGRQLLEYLNREDVAA
jgi:DNA (cytosine-5)-methyltransferase 1